MIDTTNFENYFAAKERLVTDVVQYCANHPEETYKSIGKRFGISGSLVGYYAKKHGGMWRVQGAKKANEPKASG